MQVHFHVSADRAKTVCRHGPSDGVPTATRGCTWCYIPGRFGSRPPRALVPRQKRSVELKVELRTSRVSSMRQLEHVACVERSGEHGEVGEGCGSPRRKAAAYIESIWRRMS